MKSSAVRTLFAVLVVMGFAVPTFAQDARYIVKFREGRSAAGHAALRAGGAQVVLSLGPQDAAAAHIPAAALNGLSRNPNIEYIEPDVIREPCALWSNNTAGSQTVPYGIQMVQADRVVSTNADAVKLCIIDSGYSQQHDDLKDGVTSTTTSGTGTWNRTAAATAVRRRDDRRDRQRVRRRRRESNVSLHIVKVFGNDTLVQDGSCNWTYSSTLVAALNSCTGAGAKVVSMSLGGSFKSHGGERVQTSQQRRRAEHCGCGQRRQQPHVVCPAGYASVMSVAAVDADEMRASFSQKNSDVEIAAPASACSPPHRGWTATPWKRRRPWVGGRIDGAARGTGHWAAGEWRAVHGLERLGEQGRPLRAWRQQLRAESQQRPGWRWRRGGRLQQLPQATRPAVSSSARSVQA